MLFKRYANPLPLIDGMISAGRFYEFVESFVTTEYQEKEDKTLWDFFLHKVFDQSYQDFLKSVKQSGNTATGGEIAPEALETIVKDSKDILSGFNLS